MPLYPISLSFDNVILTSPSVSPAQKCAYIVFFSTYRKTGFLSGLRNGDLEFARVESRASERVRRPGDPDRAATRYDLIRTRKGRSDRGG